MFPYLSVLIWLPIAAGIAVLLIGDKNIGTGRWVALAASVVTFLISLPMATLFGTASADFQLKKKKNKKTQNHTKNTQGLDGISMPLVVLTAFITIPVI